ncbi:hypothetical protein GGU11DRAFT_808204 [Lentinula aff. detonsa]|nr:hypothetical protein GGU11DRAFT_808204 [Lentinula aff. detonsa]
MASSHANRILALAKLIGAENRTKTGEILVIFLKSTLSSFTKASRIRYDQGTKALSDLERQVERRIEDAVVDAIDDPVGDSTATNTNSPGTSTPSDRERLSPSPSPSPPSSTYKSSPNKESSKNAPLLTPLQRTICARLNTLPGLKKEIAFINEFVDGDEEYISSLNPTSQSTKRSKKTKAKAKLIPIRNSHAPIVSRDVWNFEHHRIGEGTGAFRLIKCAKRRAALEVGKDVVVDVG